MPIKQLLEVKDRLDGASLVLEKIDNQWWLFVGGESIFSCESLLGDDKPGIHSRCQAFLFQVVVPFLGQLGFEVARWEAFDNNGNHLKTVEASLNGLVINTDLLKEEKTHQTHYTTLVRKKVPTAPMEWSSRRPGGDTPPL